MLVGVWNLLFSRAQVCLCFTPVTQLHIFAVFSLPSFALNLDIWTYFAVFRHMLGNCFRNFDTCYAPTDGKNLRSETSISVGLLGNWNIREFRL